MKTKLTFLLLLTMLLATGLATLKTQAAGPPPASGMPGNARFGYGVWADLQGRFPLEAIQLAGRAEIDWVAVEFDWGAAQPSARVAPRWGMLDSALETAAENGSAVMISVTGAPSWALGADGPSPRETAELASRLVRRYPDALLALELFPHANTRQGWGAPPNPEAYARLLEVTTRAVQQANPQVVLIAGGLTPVTGGAQDLRDTAFLDRLYRAGAQEFMPVVGVRLPPIGADPLTPRDKSSQPVLRHYEAIREVMVRNGHRNGLIWVTSFAWDPRAQRTTAQQAAWLEQSYQLLRQQLYIGAAFFDGLNPSAGKAALLPSGNEIHPGFERLIRIITENHSGRTIFIAPSPKMIDKSPHEKDR